MSKETKAFDLQDFVRESNRIEGIDRDPTAEEIRAHQIFLKLHYITIPDLEAFVRVIAPGHELRRAEGHDVRVGSYRPPPGGPRIAEHLHALLAQINRYELTPYDAHILYEKLHPFGDGNGRSGRVLWLRMRCGYAPLGFLHHFYYETLSNAQS